jgi:phosphatidyl-myo-inositol dimannoside synthase
MKTPGERMSTTTKRSRAGLATITLSDSAGGIAYVARLMRLALLQLTGADPWLVELTPTKFGRVSIGERAAFFMRLMAGQAARRADWLIFDHVGVARAQALVPWVLRRPYAVIMHDVEAWGPLTPARKLAFQKAAVRIAVSQYTQRQVSKVHPDIGIVLSCPLGLLPDADPAELGSPNLELLTSIRPSSVLIIGRMSAISKHKGHDKLLACWHRVLSKVPDAELLVVGTGDDRARLQSVAIGAGLGSSVRFLGFIPEATLQPLLRRVALFAMPSAREGFGLVYLEAMRAGLACIAGQNDAAGDTVVNGLTGLLVDPNDPDALAGAITGLLLDIERRKLMGEAGRHQYQEHYTFARFYDRIAPILASTFGNCQKPVFPG